VSGDTAYAAIEGSNPPQYVQPNATSALLTRTVEANRELLASLKVSQKHPNLKMLKPNSTLEDLAKLGFTDPAVSWAVFQALWTELTATTPAEGLEKDFQPRPPMLVTVDGLAHWMTESAYRSAEYKLIHAHDLLFVNHFLSLLKDGDSLKNGGLLLYSTSSSNNPNPKGFKIALDRLAARQAGISASSPEYPHLPAYSDADPRVLDLFQSAEKALELQTLSGLTREETRGFMEYFARSGLLREIINDQWVSEKWSLSGGGVIGELEKLGRRVRTTASASK
jgi:small subunit ribosomal protein S29